MVKNFSGERISEYNDLEEIITQPLCLHLWSMSFDTEIKPIQ